MLEPLSGYLTLVERLTVDGSAVAEGWNFGPHQSDARPVSWLAQKFVALWGHGARWRLDEKTHPHEAHYLKLDISKARARLNWEPRWTLEHALSQTVDWVRAWVQNEDLGAVCTRQINEYDAATVS